MLNVPAKTPRAERVRPDGLKPPLPNAEYAEIDTWGKGRAGPNGTAQTYPPKPSQAALAERQAAPAQELCPGTSGRSPGTRITALQAAPAQGLWLPGRRPPHKSYGPAGGPGTRVMAARQAVRA